MKGCSVTENVKQNGIEIQFGGKPSEETISALKEKGFRWSRQNRLWYIKYTLALYNWAKIFCEGGVGSNGNPSMQYDKSLDNQALIRESTLTKNGKVPKNLLLSEIEKGKMEFARFKAFDGMQDMDVYFNASDIKWQDAVLFKDQNGWAYNNLEREANTHSSNSIYFSKVTNRVNYSDFYFRYKLEFGLNSELNASKEVDTELNKIPARENPPTLIKKEVSTEEALAEISALFSGTTNTISSLPKEPTVVEPVIVDMDSYVLSGSKKEQYKRNIDIEQFIKERSTSDLNLTSDDLRYINQYSGMGGLIDQGAEGVGILYEYFTPIDLVEAMVGVSMVHGFVDSGRSKILEPACGVGRFLHYFNPHNEIVAYEINATSAFIASANFPNANIIKASYLSQFTERNGKAKAFDSDFDLVIGNPPYGVFTGSLTTFEKKVTGAATFVEYFIHRGLSQLKIGGLLVMVIPSAFLDKGEYNQCCRDIFKMATLVDAYRLPVNSFDRTDVGTDIVVFKRK